MKIKHRDENKKKNMAEKKSHDEKHIQIVV